MWKPPRQSYPSQQNEIMEITSNLVPVPKQPYTYIHKRHTKRIGTSLHLGTSRPAAHKKSPRHGPLPLLLSVLSAPTVTN
ncbi:hypothetical protein Scep_026103 [Stephania cephalantha]|uniref:Uncharacterized protein n=1 Tax=Stephania cephalantha TaxID=152367 RepID=A0AAP0HQ11_9MAGN